MVSTIFLHISQGCNAKRQWTPCLPHRENHSKTGSKTDSSKCGYADDDDDDDDGDGDDDDVDDDHDDDNDYGPCPQSHIS